MFLKVNDGRMNYVLGQAQDLFGIPPLNFKELVMIDNMSRSISNDSVIKVLVSTVSSVPNEYRGLSILSHEQIIKLVEFLKKEIQVGV